ncbi:MAG: NUDIX hydrolase [Myxococcaceae bacterium]|nr:NUDIX hydrolase [Myxococcaceae bacterium]MCI0672522.1 NUDIX hydrolase [Myxococcaceae bacterium]
MAERSQVDVTDIEVVEDFTATGRCDEGFLHVRRLRCRNLREDGSHSAMYRVDVIDRPRLDAVAVLVWRRGEQGLEVLLRENLRPAAYFRKDRATPLPDAARYLKTQEIVAGLLEPTDVGEAGLLHRAVEEVREEGGYHVTPRDIRPLGGAFFVAPGILSEKIFLTEVDVTGRAQHPPPGDGSPLEEGCRVRWSPLDEVLAACVRGELPDAKTELAIRRLLDRLGHAR